MSTSYLVFVPGIMGSELYLPGGRCVWAEHVGTIASALLQPWLLEGHRKLEVGSVLSGSLTYGPLLIALDKNGFHPNVNFLAFGYDWRQSTQVNGARLITKLAEILPRLGNAKFTLLGHSMGCLVIRAAILAQQSLQGIIAKIIELAPPHRGASKAFRQLNQFPDIHPLITRALDLIRRSWPPGMGSYVDRIFSQLNKSFPGLWDLLPPDEEEILRDSMGNTRSALHWEGWSDAVEVSGEVTRQRYALYNSMFQLGAVSIPTALVVGSGGLTEYLFDYSLNPPYRVDFQTLTPVDGDGTVIVDSAEWLKSLNPHMPYLQIIGTHTQITQNPLVHQWVLNEIP